ncbi:MAG: SusD/RagB family nutrient-binding outer membrane lipoprotein [Cytophagales bacterium]|nr:SusD/RagB family nutrient-binding outer membrane lipoprotein [Cytophagales bacterium]
MMRNKTLIAVFAVLMLSISACDNDALLDLNVNPNASNDIDLSFVLAEGQLRMSGTRYEMWRLNLIYSSTMIQHNASLAGYWSGDKYLYNAGYSASLWDRYYPDVLKSLTHVVDRSAGVAGSENLHAVASISRSFTLQRLTDVYGDIPYLQAGRGLDGQENWFPAYESQSEVFELLVTDLRAARDELDATGDALGAQDVIYGGDVASWQRWANSLLVRIGMRMSNVDEARARSVVEEAANHSAGVFTSNADNAYVQHLDGGGINRNGNSEVFRPGNGGELANARPSETFINWMRDGGDPRLMIISGGVGDPSDPGSWDTDPANQIGLPNGFDSETIIARAQADGVITDPSEFTNNLYSFLNPLLYDYDEPMMLQSFAEVNLLLAEATLMGWNVGTASADDLFNDAVRAAIGSWTVYDASLVADAAATDAYIASLDFSSASDADKMRLIGEQYWAATYFNHMESWSNWRRTGFPALTPVNYSGNVTGGVIPRRMRYPEGEIGGNPDNYSAAIANQGPDDFLTRIWWDVN